MGRVYSTKSPSRGSANGRRSRLRVGKCFLSRSRMAISWTSLLGTGHSILKSFGISMPEIFPTQGGSPCYSLADATVRGKSMPTYEAGDQFRHEFEGLKPHEKSAFQTTRREFTQVLRDWEAAGCVGIPRFPTKLGVTAMVNRYGIFELAWADDGRCTWEYGTPRRPGKCHVVWRRIGGHRIYSSP
jgi:hypothetical protein